MKRTPLKRKTPLRAKLAVFDHITKTGSRFRLAISHRIATITKRSKTKHARRERAPAEWFQFVKSQPCFVAWLWLVGGLEDRPTPCSDTIDADHMGDRMKDGDGTRARDSTCVSICHGHHMERHAFVGAFEKFNREAMRTFTSTGVQWMHNRARAAGVEIPSC